MAKDERWEPDYNEAGFEREPAMYDVANQARAHYEPIVAELRERVETLQQKLSEEPHAASECFAMIAEASRQDDTGRDDMIALLMTENEKLKAQLSRGVFVREMTDEEIGAISADVRGLPGVTDVIRACIAAATKLPEGAEWCIQRISSAGVIGFESADGSESVALSLPDGPGLVHIVFVPEVTGG